MNDILFELLKAITIVVIVILTRYFVPWIKYKVAGTQYEYIFELVSDAVAAVEQTITESGSGTVKKENVVSYVSARLAELGIEISDEQLNTLVESAVYALNQAKKTATE